MINGNLDNSQYYIIVPADFNKEIHSTLSRMRVLDFNSASRSGI
jgi:hypothetical protein